MKFKNPGMKSEKKNQESNISKKSMKSLVISKKCMNPKYLKKMKLWGKKSEIA